MNKNYKKALINEMFDRNVLNSEDDRAEAKEMLDGMEEAGDITGNFDEDIDAAIEAWNDDQEEEEPTLEEIIGNLHVGLNFIPGLGVAYAADEEDLTKMKKYLQGWLVISTALQAIFED